MDASFGLVQSIPEEEARRLHAENRRPTPPRITLNAYLLDTGDHRILIDTGIGAAWIYSMIETAKASPGVKK